MILQRWRWFVRHVLRRAAADEELDAEIRAHLALETERRIDAGESPAEAERGASRDFGNVLLVKDVTRDMWGWGFVERTWQDVRYGVRMLRKRAGFTVVAVLSLAIGIGLSSSGFALLSAGLLRPLPGAADPTGLVSLLEPVPYPFFETYRDESDFAVAAAAFVGPVPFGVMTAGETERVFGHLVSPEYFATLGVVPQAGRVFAPDTERPGSAPVVVVSDRFWRTRLNADPGAVGRTLRLNGQVVTIVGIGPEDFRGVYPANPVDLFVPVTAGRAVAPQLGDDPLSNRDLSRFRVLFRLADGVTRPAAETALDVMTRTLEADALDPERAREGRQTTLLSAESLMLLPDRQRTLVVGSQIVLNGLVLTLVCGNLAILLLARSAERRREVAIRLSLGASGFRLVRQLLTESVIIALGGGMAGILFAYWMTQGAGSGAPSTGGVDLLAMDISVDLPVLAFTVVVAVLSGVGFGLVPAIATSRTPIAGTLKGGDVAPLRRYRRFGVRNALVVYQVAAALALLLVSGVLVLGFQRSASIDPGFDTGHLTLMSIDPPRDGFSPADSALLLDRLQDRLPQLPDVDAVTLTMTPPIVSPAAAAPSFRVSVPIPGSDTTAQHTLLRLRVGTDYFSTLGIPVVRGRELEARDRRQAEGGAGEIPVVLNQTAAARLFPGRNAIDQRIRAVEAAEVFTDAPGSASGRRIGRDETLFYVVGVTADVKAVFMNPDAVPTMFGPITEASFGRGAPQGTTLALRAAPGRDAVSAVRTELGVQFPDLTLFNVRTMDEHIYQFNSGILFISIMEGGVAVFGLILAAIGLAAVITHTVNRRRKEIGIRMALGARTRQVLRLVLTEYVALVVVGGVLGFAGAAAISRGISAVAGEFFRLLLAGTGDPALLIGAPAVLVAVAFLACYVPARRSTCIDPLLALREE